MDKRGAVLIAEDDSDLREVYGDVLRDEGWDVRVACDGVDALEILERGFQPCAVILDLRMPRMDGWELARRLRQSPRWSPIPIVILAAHYRIQEEATRLGTAWWLQKPVSIDRFLDAVGRACASRQVA